MFRRKVGDVIAGKELSLVIEALAPADNLKGYVPAYIMGIFKNTTRERVGRISFRIGSNELIDRYAGHVGYTIDRQYRGNGFAEKGCRLLVDLAREHHFEALYITCDPDNPASRRTIEKLGGEFLGYETVPLNTDLYRRGDREKLRYVWRFGV